jgi:hypothetical protein
MSSVRLIRFAPRCVAGFLAALATFGLVLAPVLHGQLHASEAEQEHDRAASAAFRIAFESNRGPNWYTELVAAVEEAFGEKDAERPERARAHHHRGAERHRHHSHGPGPHGTGSLEHLALAIHAAAAPPPLSPPESVRCKPAIAPLVLHLTPNYLLPEFSQGPPRC